MKEIGRIGMTKLSQKRLLSHADIQIGSLHSKIYFWLEYLDLIECITQLRTLSSIKWETSIMWLPLHLDQIRYLLKAVQQHQLCIFYHLVRILMMTLKSSEKLWTREISRQQNSSNTFRSVRGWVTKLRWWSSKERKRVTGCFWRTAICWPRGWKPSK